MASGTVELAAVTVGEYFERCAAHDWFYAMSDDGRAYRAGAENERTLRAIAATSSEHQAVFDAWYAHKFARAARPELPGPVADDASAQDALDNAAVDSEFVDVKGVRWLKTAQGWAGWRPAVVAEVVNA